MKASTESSRLTRLAGALWRPAGLFYLAACIAGLAAGLWPGAICHPGGVSFAAPLATLRTLAVAQAAFILLVHPLILMRRSPRRYWAEAIVETVGFVLVTVPFYVAAAWLGNAVAADVVRCGVYAICLWPVAWVAGALLHRRKFAATVLIVLLVAAMGLPAGFYLAREFLSAVGDSGWLWRLAPATFAWDNASSRLGWLWPRPVWAMLVWPGLAAVALAIRQVLRK